VLTIEEYKMKLGIVELNHRPVSRAGQVPSVSQWRAYHRRQRALIPNANEHHDRHQPKWQESSTCANSP
jgi:5-methylcytosine-specific restriction endonuclease McrA